jgi:hypothetical protein
MIFVGYPWIHHRITVCDPPRVALLVEAVGYKVRKIEDMKYMFSIQYSKYS